jgi:hypothetical protein
VQPLQVFRRLPLKIGERVDALFKVNHAMSIARNSMRIRCYEIPVPGASAIRWKFASWRPGSQSPRDVRTEQTAMQKDAASREGQDSGRFTRPPLTPPS